MSTFSTRYVPPETALAAAKLSTQVIAILISSLLLGILIALLLCWWCCQRRIWRYRAKRIARQQQKQLDMDAFSSSKPYTSQLYSPPTRPQPKAKWNDIGSWGNMFRREEKRGGPLNMVLNPRINRGNAKFFAPGLERGDGLREVRRDEGGRVMTRYEIWKADGGRERPIERPRRVFFGGRWWGLVDVFVWAVWFSVYVDNVWGC